jgi:hypothetical protein
MKDKFFLTFGNKYKHELHQSGLKINPDGYILIYAHTYDLARQKAFDEFGKEWCWLYSEEEFQPSHFPDGKIGEIE